MEEIDEKNGYVFSVFGEDDSKEDFYVPEEIIAHILSFVDFDSLVFGCRLVCHSWKNIVDNLALREKAERECALELEKAVREPVSKKLILPWYINYLCHKKLLGRNLLKNNCGKDKFKHWSILSNGGDRWKIEDIPSGSDALPEDCSDFEGYTSCFSTSYHSNSKVQVINLLEEGFGQKFMDNVQPDIAISEWFSGRFDCGCVYELKVELMDKKMKPIANFEQRESIEQWKGREWHKIEHVFSNYGHGVRYISFYHGGMDTQFWAGHYGSKMAGGVVKLYYNPEKS